MSAEAEAPPEGLADPAGARGTPAVPTEVGTVLDHAELPFVNATHSVQLQQEVELEPPFALGLEISEGAIAFTALPTSPPSPSAFSNAFAVANATANGAPAAAFFPRSRIFTTPPRSPVQTGIGATLSSCESSQTSHLSPARSASRLGGLVKLISGDSFALPPVSREGTAKSAKSGGSFLVNESLGDSAQEEVAVALRSSISFRDSEYLLRAVKLSYVMGGFGSMFSSSSGSEQTYQLSTETSRIEYFLSHNWVVSRWDKFLTLSYKFHFNFAFAVTVLFCIVLGGLGVLDMVPVVDDITMEPPVTGCLCRILCGPVAILLFVFGNHIGPCAQCRADDPYVFLDKVCISQTDPDLQQQGIAHLGAFLKVSDRMLLIYSEHYFRKLWTIFEVANFLALRTVDKVDVIPVLWPRVFFLFIPVASSYNIIMLVGRLEVASGVFTYLAGLAGVMMCSAFRRFGRDKLETQDRLKNFTVTDCHCAVESDREVVYEKIANLMRATRFVSWSASMEEALQEFEMQVREKMPSAFRAFSGTTTFTYKHHLFISTILMLPLMSDRLPRMHYGTPVAQVVAELCNASIWLFMIWPVTFTYVEVMASLFLWLTGWREWLWICVSMIFLGLPVGVVYELTTYWADRAGHSDLALWSMAAAAIMISTTTFAVVVAKHLWDVPWLNQSNKAFLRTRSDQSISESNARSKTSHTIPSEGSHQGAGTAETEV